MNWCEPASRILTTPQRRSGSGKDRRPLGELGLLTPRAACFGLPCWNVTPLRPRPTIRLSCERRPENVIIQKGELEAGGHARHDPGRGAADLRASGAVPERWLPPLRRAGFPPADVRRPEGAVRRQARPTGRLGSPGGDGHTPLDGPAAV